MKRNTSGAKKMVGTNIVKIHINGEAQHEFLVFLVAKLLNSLLRITAKYWRRQGIEVLLPMPVQKLNKCTSVGLSTSALLLPI